LPDGNWSAKLEEAFQGRIKVSGRTKPPWGHNFKVRLKQMLGMKIVICDNCKWNWRSSCHRPERPNATWCPDFEKRG